ELIESRTPNPESRDLLRRVRRAVDRPARDIRDDVHQVLARQLRDHWLHQLRPLAVARAGLHVIQLAREVARRPSRDAGHRAHSEQVGSVAVRAGDGLAVAARPRQYFTLADRTDRRVGHDARARTAEHLGELHVLGRLEDAHANRLLACALALD